MNTKQPSKLFTIGNDQFVLPLIAGGFYVSDRNGRTVLQAQSFEGAKALAQMLNEQAQK
jgi:enterochelin esterase-like enzyme